MQDEKYFRAIDTVKMSDEQRDALFEKILQKENEMSSEKIAVHCYEERKFSLKNIFYPAAVAAAIAVTIASASYANKNEDVSGTLSDLSGTVSDEQPSESRRISMHSFSSAPSKFFSLTGSLTGGNYLTETEQTEESMLIPVSEDAKAPEFRDSSGNLLTNIKKAEQYGNRTAVLAYSEFDSSWAVYVYDSDLVLDYTFRNSNGSPAFTLTDSCLYVVDSEYNANAYGTSYGLILHRIPLNDVVSDIPADNSPGTEISVYSSETYNLSEYGLKYETAEGISILDSGDILIAASEKNSQLKDTRCTDAVILDHNLKIKNITTLSDSKYEEKSVKLRNGKIYLFNCRFNNTVYNMTADIWSVDESENFVYEGQNETVPDFRPCYSTGGKYGFYTYDGSVISAYNCDTDETETIPVSSEITAESLYGLYEISGETYTVHHSYISHRKICSVADMSEAADKTDTHSMQLYHYQRCSDVIHNGSIYSLENTVCSYDNNRDVYILTVTDPDSESSEQITFELPYGSRISSFCVTDEYFLFASAIYDTDDEHLTCPAVLISDRNGSIVNTVKLKPGYSINNIFAVSGDRIIAVLKHGNIYGAFRYLAYEMSSSGEDVKQIDITGAPFVYSSHCKSGMDGYEFCYISSEGIYGVKDIENPDKFDTILDFGKINLQKTTGSLNPYSLGDFGYDSETRTWYVEHCGYPSGIVEIQIQ